MGCLAPYKETLELRSGGINVLGTVTSVIWNSLTDTRKLFCLPCLPNDVTEKCQALIPEIEIRINAQQAEVKRSFLKCPAREVS